MEEDPDYSHCAIDSQRLGKSATGALWWVGGCDFPIPTITDYHKLSSLKQHKLISHGPVAQKSRSLNQVSALSLIRPRPRYWQGCASFRRLPGESVSLPPWAVGIVGKTQVPVVLGLSFPFPCGLSAGPILSLRRPPTFIGLLLNSLFNASGGGYSPSNASSLRQPCCLPLPR